MNILNDFTFYFCLSNNRYDIPTLIEEMERERETMSLYEKLEKKEKESEGTMYVLFHFLVG